VVPLHGHGNAAAAWTVAAEATFGNVVVLADQRQSLTAGGRAVIEQWNGSGILLVVTHGANIASLTGISPRAARSLWSEKEAAALKASAACFLIDAECNYTVVPAKAGTHTPRRILSRRKQ